MTRGTGLTAKLGLAVITASLATVVLAGGALAQEGSCTVTVTPASVAVGQTFTVAGNFGGAEIFIVKGANASPAEGATPDATTPAGGSFSVQFTAESSDLGDLTVWALIPASECGDSAPLTVTAASNTATATPSTTPMLAIGLVALGFAGVAAGAIAVRRRAI